MPPPKLLHNSLVGWGSLFGAATTKATPVGLIGLPLTGATMSTPSANIPSLDEGSPSAKRAKAAAAGGDPFAPAVMTAGTFKGGSAACEANYTQFHHRFVSIAAGTRHVAALTSIGNIVAMGSNRYGQVGQPVMASSTPSFGDAPTETKRPSSSLGLEAEQLPYYYDLGYEEIRRQTGNSQKDVSLDENIPTKVAAGCNHNLFFRPGTTNVITFGNNSVGQLGLGHKQMCLNTEGFAEWDRSVPWARPEDRASGIKDIVCGQMHTMIVFNSGAIYGCGSNLCGELGVGDIFVDGQPRRVVTEDAIVKNGKEDRTAIKQVAAGMNFTLFLTNEGRVYGTGSNNSNQLLISSKTPEPLLINRGMISLPSSDMLGGSGSLLSSRAATESLSQQPSPLVRIRHIAACGELGVFVTSKNEVLVRGVFSEVGFSTGSRFHAVMPMEEDRCAQGREYPHYHPEIVRVVAKESNVLLVYADGRVVAFGNNTDGQVKISSIAVKKGSEAESSVLIKGVGGSTSVADEILFGESSTAGKREVNLEKGKYCHEVALILPKPAAVSSSTTDGLHLCLGMNFGFALDTSPACVYEEALVEHYRKDREARRARGEAVEKILMTEVVFPPIPRDLGARPPKKAPSSAVGSGGGLGGTGAYRRATRGSRVVSGISPAAAAAVSTVSAPATTTTASASADGSSEAEENVSAPVTASHSSVSSTNGAQPKVSLEEMIKRRRSKLSY